ncbi:MAG: transporter substrate-binding domain-containing protein [Gammaproteobacteria bacterium]
MYDAIRSELAPNGTLRAGINLSNFLLVTGKNAAGDPAGVSPDMARAIANQLGVELELVPFPNPGALADAVAENTWNIGNIGAVAERAKTITFTSAYVEIEATYLVPATSTLQSVEDVDDPRVRIAVAERSAYGLWLEDNIRDAQLITAKGLEGSFETFTEQRLEALAGLRPRLIDDLQRVPGGRILDGKFTSVQQAIGSKPECRASAAFLQEFVEESKANGLVASLIDKHGVKGKLTVAP